jgi:hypothetical protein
MRIGLALWIKCKSKAVKPFRSKGEKDREMGKISLKQDSFSLSPFISPFPLMQDI